ncbi:MAG: hypothetical protein O7E55_01060, partial [Chloroflexi bacterium]|nr:hypothetical protein [Chloroflexota bacterium]
MSKKATWIIPGLLVTLLLGLLWALPTLAAPSSDDNTIVLSGGADGDGLFYSDRTNFNIATATVEDTGFSSQRTGVARIINGGGATTYTLNGAASIIEGEVAQTDTKSSTGSSADLTLTLTKLGRDANGDGVLDEADVV